MTCGKPAVAWGNSRWGSFLVEAGACLVLAGIMGRAKQDGPAETGAGLSSTSGHGMQRLER